MLSKKSKARGRGRRKSTPSSTTPSGAANSYRGPYHLPKSKQEAQTATIEMRFVQTISSSGAGVIAQVLTMAPNGSPEWSSFAAVWDEYRVLASEVIYEPNYNRSYSAALANSPLVHVLDRDSSGALSAYSGAWNYESAGVSNSSERFSVKAKMSGPEEALFVNTASPVPAWWVKLYSASLTASTTYGIVFITVLTQFRGRI